MTHHHTLKEGDRVRFTMNNLGAISPVSYRATDTTVGDGDEGWYFKPHPELEDWHLIKIDVQPAPRVERHQAPRVFFELVPVHESMFVKSIGPEEEADLPYAVVDTKDVPVGGQTPVLGRFKTAWEAEVYIDALPEAESGRYGLDGPEQ